MKKITLLLQGLLWFIRRIPSLPRHLYSFTAFFILLSGFLVEQVWMFLEKVPVAGKVARAINTLFNAKLGKLYRKLTAKFDTEGNSKVRRSYIIHLGYKNLLSRRTRSIVTISGMAVGIGIIVLLLSLGYGVERLVIQRIAGLEELKMIDIAIGDNTSKRIDVALYSKIKKMSRVEGVLPIISLVGKVSYNKANTDVVVYATSRDYLKRTNIPVARGSLFASSLLDQPIEKVSGVSTQVSKGQKGKPITGKKVVFDIIPETEAVAWTTCSVSGAVAGSVVRLQGGYMGMQYWGSSYETNNSAYSAVDSQTGGALGLWIQAEMPLYELDVNNILQPQYDEKGKARIQTVCIPQKYTQILDEYSFDDVLGEATESASLATYETVSAGSSSGQLEFVQLQSSESAVLATKKKDTIKFIESPSGTAVVSSAFLSLLNIPDDKALQTAFNISYIVTKNLMPEIEGKSISEEREYKIVGVIDDPSSQYLYIPFADMQQLGIKNYSQLKVVVNDKTYLPQVRKQVETLGYKTSSAVDTVAQVEGLFNNLRLVLVLIGMVALGVAALGMFNTLTVSLLERTREIGGMKTMGMISSEVQDLFLAEAMIMGLTGGIGGVSLGFLAGKVLSLIVSAFGIASGQGYLELSYVPPYLVVVILLFSFIVGLVTGIYPAQRAKKISALNALRYE